MCKLFFWKDHWSKTQQINMGRQQTAKQDMINCFPFPRKTTGTTLSFLMLMIQLNSYVQTSSSWSAEQRVDTVAVIVPHVSLSSK